MSKARIAVSRPLHPEQADAVEAFAELLDDSVERCDLPGLAGPNELLQVVVDAEYWERVLAALFLALGTAGVSFSHRIGAHLADEVWHKRAELTHALKSVPASALAKLVEILRQTRAKGNTISATIPHKINTVRNAGLVITAEAPGDIVAQLAVFAGKAKAIEAFLNQVVSGEGRFLSLSTNPDCSTRVEINADGKIVIPAMFHYDSQGHREHQHVRVLLK